MIKSINNNKLEFIFLIFIILQPIIDVITAFSVYRGQGGLTLGTVVRFLAIAFSLYYIFFNNKSFFRKPILYYVVLFGGILLINLLINFTFKPNFILIEEIKYLIKLAYFPIILLTYLVVLYNVYNRTNWGSKVINPIVISMFIIGLIMLVSELTNTSYKSYIGTKEGHVGWFFAGNEIGAILAIGYPIAVYYALYKTSQWKNIINWIPVFLITYSLLALGTKAGYGTIVIVLIITLIYTILGCTKKILKSNFQINIKNLYIVLALIFTVIIYTPFSPVIKNTAIHFDWLGIGTDNSEIESNNQNSNEETGTKPGSNHQPKPSKPENTISQEQLDNFIFSGRETFLNQHKEFFANAPMVQKVFGMGYAGNYEVNPKLVERDFHDIFYSLGILGFFVYLLPAIIIAISIFISIFKNLRKFLYPHFIFLATSIVLGLGIAFTAGHVLLAPAVSIYFAISISLLYLSITDEKYNKN